MNTGYNQRLFSGRGLRSFYHNWRFSWLRQRSKEYLVEDIKMIELGCFDARSLGYLPRDPVEYVGLDADWEGGLSVAKSRYVNHKNLKFIKSTSPNDLAQFATGYFNAAAALETLEHITPDHIESYLGQLSRITNGYVFISVPNEKGIIFLVKRSLKLILGAKGGETYTPAEFLNATMGRMSRVKRHEHKGFDHAELRREVSRYFDIIETVGGPFPRLPLWLNMTVAFVAKSKYPPVSNNV